MRLVPPGGFAGFSQMTPASQSALTKSTGGGGKRKRKAKTARSLTEVKPRGKLYRTTKKGKRVKTRDPRKRRRRGKRGSRLKKGSPAAKARMAKLRNMRKK